MSIRVKGKVTLYRFYSQKTNYSTSNLQRFPVDPSHTAQKQLNEVQFHDQHRRTVLVKQLTPGTGHYNKTLQQ